MNDRDFPEMIIETGKDTVKVGEIYRAKISLSDTSLLYYYDDFNRIRRRTHPVFRINDELVDSHQDYYIYETVVDSSEIKNFSDGTKFKEWSVELAFPHPSGFGDVTLSARMNYIIEN